MKYAKEDSQLMALIHKLEEDRDDNAEKLDFLWRAVRDGGATCSDCDEFKTDENDVEWLAEFKTCMTCEKLKGEIMDERFF